MGVTAYAVSLLVFNLVGAAVHLRHPAAAGPPAAEPRPRPRHEPHRGLQHGGELRDQHQLAGLRARDGGELPLADARPGARELRLGRRGHGGGGRLHPRPHAPLGAASSATSGSTSPAASSTSCCRSRSSSALFLVSQGVVQNLNGPTHAVTVEGTVADDRPGPVRLAGDRSRSWAPTAAASTTPTRPTPTRTRRRSPTSSRCWRSSPSRSRFTYTFGRFAGDQRQGWALFAAAMVLLLMSVGGDVRQRAEGQPEPRQARRERRR